MGNVAGKQHLDFEGQRPGEAVLFIFRRHIIAMRKGFYGLLIPFAVSSIPPLIWSDNLLQCTEILGECSEISLQCSNTLLIWSENSLQCSEQLKECIVR